MVLTSSGKSQITAVPEAFEKGCQHFSSSVLQQFSASAVAAFLLTLKVLPGKFYVR